MDDNDELQKLQIQHNNIGGKSFHLIGTALEHHPNLTYFDISYNKLENNGFQHLFFPISRNRTKLEELQCRGNEIGGKSIDKILSSISRSLRVLNLNNNQLNEMNGQILLDTARNNVVLEQVSIDNNEQVNADHIT